MLTKFLRCVSTLLVVVMLANMVPVQALSNTRAESIGQIDGTEIIEAFPSESPGSADEAVIVGEIADGRTEYSKEFLLSDGLHLATVYPEPVHYMKDGKWEDINNTLVADGKGSYRNTAGIWDVSFPQSSGSQKAVTITKDGYTLSFGMPQKLAPGNSSGAEVMSIGRAEETLSTSQVASVTAQVEATVDAVAAKAETQHPETVLHKLSSRMTYAGVYTGTDVVYDLRGNRVKESVVLAQYDPSLRGYRYNLNTGRLIPQLQGDGSILFYDPAQTEVIMVMESPFLLDKAMESSTDIEVSLTGANGHYVLTYILPAAWLADEARQWPVILDPQVTCNLTRTNIYDVLVCSNGSVLPLKGYLDLGYEGGTVKRTYVRYGNLPPLHAADTVVSATMSMWQMYYRSLSVPAQVHQVTEDWSYDTLSWTNQPDYDPVVTDFVRGHSAVEYQWDVTDIVQDWYTTGENYGLLFRSSDAVEAGPTTQYRQFYSSDYGVIYRPTLKIIFRNANGLESYWDYASASAGRAGTGYVNTYTGNLVFTRSLLGFGGNRMPVSISLVYNINDIFPDDYDVDKGFGHGWRSTWNQRIYDWRQDLDGDGTIESNERYYAWEDSDGTVHYFNAQSGSGQYADEEGLELTLKTSGSGSAMTWTLTDKNGNTSYFDRLGRLYKQENNQKEKSSIQITYTAADSYLISTITDGAGRVYRFSYTDGLATRVGYYGSGTEEITGVTLAYQDGELTQITDADGESTFYVYDELPAGEENEDATETVDTDTPAHFNSHVLTTVQDLDGYTLHYTYYAQSSTFAPARVKSVLEKDGNVSGGILSIAYGQNQTVLTSGYLNGDGVYQEESSLTYQFNSYGNVVSVQDDEGRAQYSTFGWNADDSTGAKGHQLAQASKLQNTVVNLLTDSSFENSTNWISETSSCSISTEEHYLGSKSLKVVNGDAFSPLFTAEAGKTYTFSGNVKVLSGTAELILITQNGAYYTLGAPTSDSGWTRQQVSYTNNTSSDQQVYASVRVSGTSYLDCVQVEQMPTASRYNLINNGDFRSGLTGWSVSGSGVIATTDAASPQLEGSVCQVTGNYTNTFTLSQSIPVSGAAGDSYVFSGWAKGRSAALDGLLNGIDKEYALQLTFTNTDGTTTTETVQFNHNMPHWQYAAAAAVAEKAYSGITVKAIFNNNANTVYFDGLQLFKEEFGTSYTYDSDGNVISVVDLQKKNTTYEYSDNNLTKIIQDGVTKFQYTYDNWHNVKTATTDEELTYSFTYDDYGNNTEVSISATDEVTGAVSKITSKAVYSADGNLMVKSIDALGNETQYGYDADTGLVQWIQYPEDTAATRTEYTYDSMYRTARVSADLDSTVDGELYASYGYSDDLLTSIQTPTTHYSFTYGDFSLRTRVDIGDRNLAQYSYESGTNRLQRLDYGNGDRVQYTYDSQGRLITETYEDGETVTYAYDNVGNLATVTDSETGIVTTYYYDLLNRQSGYREIGAGLNHSVTYEYDADNNLASMTETLNGTTKTYTYTYDDDNRIVSETVDGVTVEYSYDGFGRLESRVVKQGNTVVLSSTPTYSAGAEAGTTTGQISSYNGYTYTYDDNGNILTVSNGTNTTSYVYDSANQLIREDNELLDVTYTWEYDASGNIINRGEYSYTTGTLGDVQYDLSYEYTDESWGDLLTFLDGDIFSYDEIGNPLDDGNRTYTWQHGRQLASMSDGTTTWTYTYDANGLRTKRTDGTHTYTYVYNGSLLTRMTVGSDTFYFTYNASGTPLTVSIGTMTYYYVTNLQGDVIGILNSSGEQLVTYAYDAWGNVSVLYYIDQIVDYNPLLYRGYVYDYETGMYYLQSRYYNPRWGRFINADAYATTGQGFVGNNMFAYCGNNPIVHSDPSGKYSINDFWNDLKGLWNDLEDGIWKLGAEILLAAGYRLTAELLTLCASGPNNSYFASDDDYAAKLIANDKGFVDRIKNDFITLGKYYSSKLTDPKPYEFPLSNGDLGAALHNVQYRYCTTGYDCATKTFHLKVVVTDTFDFTELKNPFTQGSLKKAFLWLVNDIAYYDMAWGLLDPVNVAIVVDIEVNLWR